VLQVARVVTSSASRVVFELDGVLYEIDLDSMDTEQVRESLSEFIKASQRRLKRLKRVSPAAGEAAEAVQSRERPAWIGAGHLGPDFASRAKDVLRDEMGQRKA
jgi:hypothetical protein